MTSTAPYITHHKAVLPQVAYGFFGRQGGVSSGIYNSLNCGFGSSDDASDVAQNRAIAGHSLAREPAKMASAYQIHSAEVITLTDSAQLAERPRADGLVTNMPDIVLSILTADCTPVILASHDGNVIGACHAGWRGAAGGIIQNTVAAMVALGAHIEGITAVIGPTIAKASYQVGADMREEALCLAPHAAPFFEADSATGNQDESDKYLFDLPAFAAACAKQAGVQAIYDVERDTYRESEVFFSHRYATHHAQSDSGRQISLITKTNHVTRP